MSSNSAHVEIKSTPLDWNMVKLRDVAKTSSGGTPSRANPEFFVGTIPWVKSGELEDNVLMTTEEKISESALDNSSAKIFPIGTVLIAMYGATTGKTALLGIPAATNQAICAIFPQNGVLDPTFLRIT